LATALLVTAGGAATVIWQQRLRLVDADANEIWHQLAPVQQFAHLDAAAVAQLLDANARLRLAFALKLRSDPGLARLFHRHAWALTRAMAGRSADLRESLALLLSPPR
jgi:hypothetical protein